MRIQERLGLAVELARPHHGEGVVGARHAERRNLLRIEPRQDRLGQVVADHGVAAFVLLRPAGQRNQQRARDRREIGDV
jgi:hypothetical protein